MNRTVELWMEYRKMIKGAEKTRDAAIRAAEIGFEEAGYYARIQLRKKIEAEHLPMPGADLL